MKKCNTDFPSKFLLVLLIAGLFTDDCTGFEKNEFGVIQVTTKNFHKVASPKRISVLYFYAKWCPNCDVFQHEFNRFAADAQNLHAKLLFGQVDADKQTDLLIKTGVRALPTLLLFRFNESASGSSGGAARRGIAFNGAVEAARMRMWLQRRIAPEIHKLTNLEHAKQLIVENAKHHRLSSLIGFFRNHKSKLADKFRSAVKDIDYFQFGITNSLAVFDKYGIREPNAIVIFKPFSEKKIVMSKALLTVKNLTARDIINFAVGNRKPLVLEFRPRHARRLFCSCCCVKGGKSGTTTTNNNNSSSGGCSATQRTHLLFLVNSTKLTKIAAQKFNRILPDTARLFQGEIQFVRVNMEEESNRPILRYFDVTPTAAQNAGIIVRMWRKTKPKNGGAQKFKPSKELVDDLAGIRHIDEFVAEFVTQVRAGTLQPYLRSTPASASGSAGKPEISGSEFHAFLEENRAKTVAVYFYVKWCSECVRFEQIWKELSSKLSSDVVLTKINMEENEIADFPRINGFPAVLLFPKNSLQAFPFQSKTASVASLSEFIEKDGAIQKSEQTNEERGGIEPWIDAERVLQLKKQKEAEKRKSRVEL